MTISPTTVHLLFKTHLDIGFTDLSANVVQTYVEKFIPQALALAERTRDSAYRFRWTTGAWLIYNYLEEASPENRRRMEAAITAGDIRWHALPFTTHTELMDESLFRFALTYAQTLDRRFGQTTIAAKLTDVPGHTRAIVPLLAEAGIKLLHIGVNEASSVPDVPPVFLWRDEASSAEIIMVYRGEYGGVTSVPALDHALALVLTNDNAGPPADTSIAETYRKLATDVPNATVIASTLDDFARQLETVRATLPVLTSEIGDTWIHGAGTDPTKVSRYRELSRLRREWLTRTLSDTDRQHIEQFSRRLIMIPEHTWSMDEKSHMLDHTHYLAPDLATLRQTDAAKQFESSWTEQRAYITQALDQLAGSPLAAEATARLDQIAPHHPDLTSLAPATNPTLLNSRFEVAFDPATGAITHLLDGQTGFAWADINHTLALLRYERFGSKDYARFWEQYNRNRDNPEVVAWGWEDFTKPGLPLADHRIWQPQMTAAYQDGAAHAVFALEFPDEAREFGAPRQLFLDYTLTDDGLTVALSWFDKPACRLPEAFWLSFQPHANQENGWRFEKIGSLIDPRDVVSRGARTLHAIDQTVAYQEGERGFELASLDAPLVAPGQPSLLNFHNRIPEMRGGVHVNLYNNVWGTNFPMWFEDDAQFRFVLRFT
jgi:hypothetical protein